LREEDLYREIRDILRFTLALSLYLREHIHKVYLTQGFRLDTKVFALQIVKVCYNNFLGYISSQNTLRIKPCPSLLRCNHCICDILSIRYSTKLISILNVTPSQVDVPIIDIIGKFPTVGQEELIALTRMHRGIYSHFKHEICTHVFQSNRCHLLSNEKEQLFHW
jgi:hypothetical protein